MPVYVDELFNTVGMSAAWRFKQSCHMKADTEQELHAMAAKLGLRREWFQDHVNPAYKHYDLTASKRALALKYGAIPLTWRDMARRTTETMERHYKGRSDATSL